MRILLLIVGLLLLAPGLCAAAFTPFIFDPNSFSIVFFFWLPGAILGALGVWALVAAIRGNKDGTTNGRVGLILLGLAGAVLAVPGVLGLAGLLNMLVYLPNILSGEIPLADFLVYGLGGNLLLLAIGAVGVYMIGSAIRKLRALTSAAEAAKRAADEASGR